MGKGPTRIGSFIYLVEFFNKLSIFYSHMFVASRTAFGHTHIDIQTLHGGGDHHHIIESKLGDDLIQFAVDRQIGEVYICDSDNQQISWTDYTGELVQHPKIDQNLS